jgi:acyl-coenzyme A synthetase/AMP-(fatty) acid ligase
MQVLQSDLQTLWGLLSASGRLSDRFIRGVDAIVCLADLVARSSLQGGAEKFRGRSVLLATRDQFSSALALIELDGIARRMVLCPHDLPAAHLDGIISTAHIDLVLTDATGPYGTDTVTRVAYDPRMPFAASRREGSEQTEWVLLTSGTTGPPKLVLHTLLSLSGPIVERSVMTSSIVWSTFYDIRRYGGLQIYLRALLGGGSLVLSSPKERTGAFLIRAGEAGVTHISGTPSHWRRALMSPSTGELAPRYVRLSGEIADRAILDRLRTCYPAAKIAHAFASTEAGVAFAVEDGLPGFPAALIGRNDADVEMKVEDGSLLIRSSRTAHGYLDDAAAGGRKGLADSYGFVDTGDMVERRGDRYFFVGRRDGIINVGGLKVYPEEVECVINEHPGVRFSMVRSQTNPIVGAVVVADVVLTPDFEDADSLRHQITEFCHRSLFAYKVPAVIRFVPSLDMAATGKLARR